MIPERRARANESEAYGVWCGTRHSPIHKGENLHGNRLAVVVARFPTFTGELGVWPTLLVSTTRRIFGESRNILHDKSATV